MTGPGGAEPLAPPGGSFPAVYVELRRLARQDPSSAEVARHRLFAGSSIEEIAEAPGLSRATAFREWAYARSWLATALDSAR